QCPSVSDPASGDDVSDPRGAARRGVLGRADQQVGHVVSAEVGGERESADHRAARIGVGRAVDHGVGVGQIARPGTGAEHEVGQPRVRPEVVVQARADGEVVEAVVIPVAGAGDRAARLLPAVHAVEHRRGARERRGAAEGAAHEPRRAGVGGA
ncbi:MAG: hypothetical protein ACK56I_36105, partial [bacterium]